MDASQVYLNRAEEHAVFQDTTQYKINLFLENYFNQRCNWSLFPLFGGHSDAKNYFFEMEGIPYVLRIENPNVPLEHNLKELFSFEGASKRGAAPRIYAISPDFSYLLIEYLNIPTLSLKDAKTHVVKLAEMISKIHAMPQNPYAKKSQIAQFMEIYKDLKKDGMALKDLDEAVQELEPLDIKIGKHQAAKATLHGDLHPRNLFLTKDKRVLAVDWEGTNVDDPFYDLGFCSLLHSLDENEEREFLHAYKQREFTSEEFERYSLCKRASLIFLSILCISQAHELTKINGESYQIDSPLENWSIYIQGWSEKGEHPAQFFFNWGRSSLQKLNS